MAIQFEGGAILFIGGQIAMDAACCCEITDCPSDCSGCGSFSVTLAANASSLCGAFLSTTFNNFESYTAPGEYGCSDDSCTWLDDTTVSGWYVLLCCTGGQWYIEAGDGSPGAYYGMIYFTAALSSCPPTGSWTYGGKDGCSGAETPTPTCVLA